MVLYRYIDQLARLYGERKDKNYMGLEHFSFKLKPKFFNAFFLELVIQLCYINLTCFIIVVTKVHDES